MTRLTRNKSSLINTHKTLSFVFDGKKYKGFEGDTLASVSYTHLTLPTKA